MNEEEVEWANGDRSIFADLLPDEKTRKASEERKEAEDFNSPEEYLDHLRETGEVNMFEAVPHLEQAWGLMEREARSILSAWMKTFRSESEGGPSSPSDDIVVVIDKDKTDAV